MALTAAGAESENFWILHSILNRMSFGQVITDMTLIFKKGFDDGTQYAAFNPDADDGR